MTRPDPLKKPKDIVFVFIVSVSVPQQVQMVIPNFHFALGVVDHLKGTLLLLSPFAGDHTDFVPFCRQLCYRVEQQQHSECGNARLRTAVCEYTY